MPEYEYPKHGRSLREAGGLSGGNWPSSLLGLNCNNLTRPALHVFCVDTAPLHKGFVGTLEVHKVVVGWCASDTYA